MFNLASNYIQQTAKQSIEIYAENYSSEFTFFFLIYFLLITLIQMCGCGFKPQRAQYFDNIHFDAVTEKKINFTKLF